MNKMNAHRYLATFVSLIIALALVLASTLSSVTVSGIPLLQGTLTPTAFEYLPYVVRQYPPPAITSTATPTHTPTSTATPTHTPIPTPVPGHWIGITNLGHPMSFDVSADGQQWSNFTLKTSGQVGPCSVTITTTVYGPGAITDNQFSGGGGTYSFSGQFISSTTANGVYTYTNYYIYGCGYFNQTGAWAANKP